MKLYRDCFKRVFDFTAATCAAVALSPLLLGIAVWLHFANKGAGVLFSQERPGKNGKIFRLYKFKSMTDERGPDGKLLPNERRITPVGRFLRSTSLDELPQLINIIRGDISIIGPRPLLEQYLPLYSPEQARRHEIRPGVTGWAQVHGRNAISWTRKFELDVWYVDHVSFRVDMKILFLTALKVLRRADINGVSTEIGAEPFNGHN